MGSQEEKNISNGVSESHFYMWRAVFALAHVDNKVDEQEVRFMAEAMEDVGFSDAQRIILNSDMHEARDVEEMFSRVSDKKDQSKFFNLARELAWVDGDFGKREQEIMLRLQEVHVKSANIEEMIGDVEMEFEGDELLKAKQSKAPEFLEKKLEDGDIDIDVFTFSEFFKKLFQKFK